MAASLWLSILFSLCFLYFSEGEKKVVCYYGSWATYRPGDGKFDVEHIDPFLCTHLIYSFAGLDGSNRIKTLDPYYEENRDKGAYKRLNNLKKQNPQLKTLIAIGGWNEGSAKYSQMASSASNRKVFISSVVSFIRTYGFDGLDLDWEYPANRGGSYSDKQNFGILVKELRSEFDKYGWLLTAAVAAGKYIIDSAYDIPTMARYLHFINVMTYDFHGSWERQTGLNAPLYSRPGESFNDQLLNVNYSIHHWMASGAPANKLVLGMGLYGRSFTLSGARNHGIAAPATGPGRAGPYTREAGMLGYNEICDNIANKGWTVSQDSHQSAPFAYSDTQWVGFDDRNSIKVKCQYANSLGLAGGMVWSIETDDFHGRCHGIKFPLIQTIRNVLNSKDSKSPLPVIPTQKPEIKLTTKSTDPKIRCTENSFLRHPTDCTRYVRCISTNVPGSFNVVEYQCKPGLVFNTKIQACYWPRTVPECN